MKILIFGKNGQVGWELQRSLAPLGELVALDRHSKELCGDLGDPEGIARTVLQVRPDIVINAAAYTAVDKAESDADAAHVVNAAAPAAMARAAGICGAWLFHYSTDYVFDGSGATAWREQDPTAPLSVYGKTKLEGERGVIAHCGRHIIFRTSWVYAARGGNFAKTMLRLAGERDRLTVVNDQFGAPTGADLLADVTAHVVRNVQTKIVEQSAGIYHLAAAGETSWHGYATFVLNCAFEGGARLRASPSSVDPVPGSAFPTAAKRPYNSRLDSTKLEQTFALKLPAWQPGVARMLAEIT